MPAICAFAPSASCSTSTSDGQDDCAIEQGRADESEADDREGPGMDEEAEEDQRQPLACDEDRQTANRLRASR